MEITVGHLRKTNKRLEKTTVENVNRNFDFGCTRLPVIDGDVDHSTVNLMIDAFIEVGFNYFDIAYGLIIETLKQFEQSAKPV